MANIVLDPTELYEIPPGYRPITTDVEWFRFFGVDNSPCWVQGKRLCEWAQLWLRVRNRTSQIIEVKVHPRVKLEALFPPLLSHWTDAELLSLATKLDSYPQDNPIAYLLADITGSNQQIWVAEPAIEHLAAWLAVVVPAEWGPLERVWQQRFPDHDLGVYYRTKDKLSLLRRWLGITEDPSVVEALGRYPLPIPDVLTEEFDRYWEQELLRSQGKVLDRLVLNAQPGIERIQTLAYHLFKRRPTWLNQVKETTLNTYLTYQQKQDLSQYQPPPQPQPLALDATPQAALSWATASYLPFRRWETLIQPTHRISEEVAASFVEWIGRNYPMMIVDSVANSVLNYSVASWVQALGREGPVLWVVVDGLGWLDHQELISLLKTHAQLALVGEMEPKISILPTKTEYAKWSLYAQLLPCDAAWVADASKGFTKMRMGSRYTDRQFDQLRADLAKKAHRLYCWDTDTFDSLYHSQRDWQSFYQMERPHELEGIAKRINLFVQEYPNPENLRVVIASDHGQIMGTSERISPCPPGLEPKGRMAIGRTDDPRFMVLEGDRFGLPHDISVVRSSATFSAFNYTDRQAIGCHGGLFPEEVVVGVSILQRAPRRLPVSISCYGEGKPKQGGELKITVDNPNSLPLTELCLHIEELPCFRSGYPLVAEVGANKQVGLKVAVPDVPELPPTHGGRDLSLSGKLTFRFANGETGETPLSSDSRLTVNQIFSSGGIDIDEFL